MRSCITECDEPVILFFQIYFSKKIFSGKYTEVLELFGKIGYYKGKQVCVNFNKLNFN